MKVELNDSGTFTLIEKYINDNYKIIDRKHLFEIFHYNKNYFYEIIKKNTGMTFIEYIQDVRVTKAAELLSNTDRSIISISEAVGYNNTAYFYKIFKKKHKITPKEYRMRAKRARVSSEN